MHSFLVADESNQSTLYTTNFGSWYFGFVFARWSSSSRTSLFPMFKAVDDTDDDFDTADNDDGEDAKKRSVDDQVDTVKGVENNGDDSTTNDQRLRTQFVFLSEFLMLTYQRLSF